RASCRALPPKNVQSRAEAISSLPERWHGVDWCGLVVTLHRRLSSSLSSSVKWFSPCLSRQFPTSAWSRLCDFGRYRMTHQTQNHAVIAINGPPGAGKSRLVHALVQTLGEALPLHFDDYQPKRVPPSIYLFDPRQWLAEGADPNA